MKLTTAPRSTVGLLIAVAIAFFTATTFVPLPKTLSIAWIAFVLIPTILQFLIFLAGLARSSNTATLIIVTYIVTNLVAIILMFANLYLWLGIRDGSETTKSFLTALYYSASTWTTLTYGDIVPLADARPIAALQALTGYVVMAFLIAIILSRLQKKP